MVLYAYINIYVDQVPLLPCNAFTKEHMCAVALIRLQVDINLVASVGEECYVALDKGPITPQHVLIVPIEHFPSSMAVPEGCYEEMQRYLSALKACFAAQVRGSDPCITCVHGRLALVMQSKQAPHD